MVTRMYDLEQTNREQRQTIDDLKETIRLLKQQDLQTRLSLYNKFAEISNLGHSNDLRKNIKMTDIADKVTKEMWEDLRIELYADNDEEGKKKELDASTKPI